MSNEARKQYLEEIHHRYHSGTREERSRILDEFCRVCGYNRKYAIRLLHRAPPSRRPPPTLRAGRPRVYVDARIVQFLNALWRASNLVCADRLHAMIPDWLPFHERVLHRRLPDSIVEQLLSMSASTIEQLLAPARRAGKKMGLATTKPGSFLKHHVPIRTNQWDEQRPGFIEADSVAHCGDSTAGMYVITVNIIDIATGWGEQRAVWGKGERGVKTALEQIEDALPFPLRGFDCDNGSEFLNHLLYKHFLHRKTPVAYTRARAYHKNDNAHIEEKNWTRIRQYLGYDRFDNSAMVDPLNDLYATEWRDLINFFLPSVKLISKTRLGARIIKRYDAPQSPYQRVLESPVVSAAAKERLRARFQMLDPFALQQAVRRKIDRIHTIPHSRKC